MPISFHETAIGTTTLHCNNSVTQNDLAMTTRYTQKECLSHEAQPTTQLAKNEPKIVKQLKDYTVVDGHGTTDLASTHQEAFKCERIQVKSYIEHYKDAKTIRLSIK